MKFAVMKNSEIFCLKELAKFGGWMTAHMVVSARWRSTQPEKKARTYSRHLDRLVRHGFAVKAGLHYQITDAGRLACNGATERNRPLMLGLA